MKTTLVNTSLGKIAVYLKEVNGTIPVIFLHGVYFDHNLWKYQMERILDRTILAVDMPFHGESKDITKKEWTLDDCANMLIEILDALQIEKAIAIGHSWGSMTILRAACKFPEKFQSVGLCNMPFQSSAAGMSLLIRLQHLMLGFRKFYTKQAAKALYGKDTFKKNPLLLNFLESSMNKLSDNEVIHTDTAVRINAEDAEPLIKLLKIPVFALRGKEDYVPQSKCLNYRIVEGGHVSPVEVPEDVFLFVKEVIDKN